MRLTHKLWSCLLFLGVPVPHDQYGFCNLVSDHLIRLFSVACEGVSTVMNNTGAQPAIQQSFEKT